MDHFLRSGMMMNVNECGSCPILIEILGQHRHCYARDIEWNCILTCGWRAEQLLAPEMRFLSVSSVKEFHIVNMRTPAALTLCTSQGRNKSGAHACYNLLLGCHLVFNRVL